MGDWKDDILNSMEGHEKARPSEDVFQKITMAIQEKPLSKKQWLAVAASVALILSANIYFMLTYDSIVTETEQEESYSSLVNDYTIY